MNGIRFNIKEIVYKKCIYLFKSILKYIFKKFILHQIIRMPEILENNVSDLTNSFAYQLTNNIKENRIAFVLVAKLFDKWMTNKFS